MVVKLARPKAPKKSGRLRRGIISLSRRPKYGELSVDVGYKAASTGDLYFPSKRERRLFRESKGDAFYGRFFELGTSQIRSPI